MTTAYGRPFLPVDLDSGELKKFAIRPMLEQLRREDSLSESGRASLTLVHGPGLTGVLTVAQAGTVFEEHEAGGPTLLLILGGTLSVMPAASQSPIALTEGDAFALGPDVRHVLKVISDCAFLTIIGEQATAESS